MRRVWRLLIVALFTLIPAITLAGPAEDAGSVVNHWAEAFNANDVDSLIDLYAPDAIFIGTSGAGLIEGKDAIHAYFTRLANSGDKVAIDALKVIVLHDDNAFVTGLYTFAGFRHDQPRTTQAAFTMVLVKRGNEWLIAHHHSSRRSAPASAAPPLRRS
jgi:uncharacterized protein (TIGR02246 family)